MLAPTPPLAPCTCMLPIDRSIYGRIPESSQAKSSSAQRSHFPLLFTRASPQVYLASAPSYTHIEVHKVHVALQRSASLALHSRLELFFLSQILARVPEQNHAIVTKSIPSRRLRRVPLHLTFPIQPPSLPLFIQIPYSLHSPVSSSSSWHSKDFSKTYKPMHCISNPRS